MKGASLQYVQVPHGAEIAIQTWQGSDTDFLFGYQLSDFDLPGPDVLHQHFIIARLNHTWDDDANAMRVDPQVTVLDCVYSGSDVKHFVSVSDQATPIEFLRSPEPEVLADLTSSDMEPAAVAIDLVLSGQNRDQGARSGDGGAMMNGLEHAGLQRRLYESRFTTKPEIDFATLIEAILTDAAQAYFTLLRQSGECWLGSYTDAAGGELRGRALRVGGRGWVWIAILAVLAAVPLVALVRTAVVVCLCWHMVPDEDYDSNEDSIAEGLLDEKETFVYSDTLSHELTKERLSIESQDSATVLMGIE
jgi:hypothetical protein